MRQVRIQRDLDSFRAAARSLLARDIEPNGIAWVDENEPTLLEEDAVAQLSSSISVSPHFFELCRLASCHRDRERWPLMYRLLWRVTHG
jgi:DNA polymerase